MNNNEDGVGRDVHSTVMEVLGAVLVDLAWAGDAAALSDWRQRCESIRTLDPEAPVAPWLLTHEFLCHVQQEPVEPIACGAAPFTCRSDCPFFEGWMDEVAFGLFTTSVVSAWKERTIDMTEAANDSRRARYSGSQSEECRLISQQWALGREAARILMRFFDSSVSYDRDDTRKRAALAQLVGLSFRIQAATGSPPGLRRIVNSCLLAGQCALSFMRASERGELLRLLTQPIVDINEWITRLESLWRHFPI